MLHGLSSRDIVLREGRGCAPQRSCLTRRSPGHISTPKKIPPPSFGPRASLQITMAPAQSSKRSRREPTEAFEDEDELGDMRRQSNVRF